MTVSSISFNRIQELITGIYDAALDEQQWHKTLNSLSALFSAQQGNLRIVDSKYKNIDRIYNLNKDPYWLKAYSDYFVHIDPWMEMIYENKDTLIECSHHLIPDKEYKAMEIHRDYITPQDIHFGIGGIININKDMRCYIAFQRGEKYDGFTPDQVHVLNILAPHIHKAILINEKTTRLELENNTLCNSLNQLNSSILLVDNNGKILFVNTLAENLINQQCSISIKNNCISLPSQPDNTRLKKLINAATLSNSMGLPKRGGAMSYTDPASQVTLSILVSPINPEITNIDIQTSDIAMLVMSTNKHKTTLSVELLSALYKLTPAEARLTLELCNGFSLDEISEMFCRSKNTLRTQLRSCFNKTGTSRQAELINLIHCGPANILNPK